MIKKIIKIQNTGSFSNFICDQRLVFKKLNLFYGENGSGKSTFSTIIKSLSTDNPKLIFNKKTILEGKELGNPCCKFKLNNFTYKFENSEWISCNPNSNYQLKNILVFDDEYMEKNIFTFLESNINHARNQYKIIFGEAGVELNKEKECLVKNKNSLKPALDKAKNDFFLKYELTIEDYEKYEFTKTEELLREEIDEIKKQIQANQNSLSKKNIEFQLLEQFNLVSKDEIDELNQLLSTDIKSEAHLKAKKEVEKFKQNYFHQGSSHDQFLKYGIANVNKTGKKICPLCHNEFQEDLFDLYRNYFDTGYDKLVANLEAVKLKFVEVSVNDLLLKNTENLKVCNFWKNYIKDLNELKIEIKDTVDRYNQSIKNIQKKIALKKEETSKTDFKIENLDEITTKIKNIIQTYNNNLNENIIKIQNYQKSIATIDLNKIQTNQAQLKKELDLLEQKDNIQADITTVNKKSSAIQKCEVEIEGLNIKIEKELSKITEAFIQKINGYLEYENFKVSKIELPNQKNFSELHCEIGLEFNEKPVKIYGKSKTDRLNDFLSTGEKRSLGFAFFMASLESENRLEDKVLIFDDPITSLDYDRKLKVARKLIHTSKNVSQVFILTHDRNFFYHSFTESKRLKANQYHLVKKIGNSSNIEIARKQDIKHLICKNHHYTYWKLKQYSLGLHSLNEPANLLRKLFEDLLEYKFPETCKKVRDRNYKTLFTSLSLQIFVDDDCFNQAIFEDIKGNNGDESILDFVNNESHTSSAEFTDQEKRNYVKKGLKIFKTI